MLDFAKASKRLYKYIQSIKIKYFKTIKGNIWKNLNGKIATTKNNINSRAKKYNN